VPTLAALAGLADEWKKERPDTPADLARRLVENREVCAATQLADGRQNPTAPSGRHG
jgi:hypothetical protein